MTVAAYVPVKITPLPETRAAWLICGKCKAPRIHLYAHTSAFRDTTGRIALYHHQFQCVDCGALRRWGAEEEDR